MENVEKKLPITQKIVDEKRKNYKVNDDQCDHYLEYNSKMNTNVRWFHSICYFI